MIDCMGINEEIGQRLRIIREYEGLEQAEIIGNEKQRKISNVETGKQKVDLEVLLFWHKKGYDLNWITTGEGKRMRDSNDELESLRELRKSMKELITKSEI